MSRNVSFEGFVLKKTQLLEGDYVVTFLTKDSGKLKMVAKGIKKITSKRASHLQTGNKLRWFASRHLSGIWYLGTTNLVSGIIAIKDNEQKSGALYMVLQVMDIILPEEQYERNIYRAFTIFLKELASSQSNQKILAYGFVEQLVEYLGFGKKTIVNNADLSKVIFEVSGVKL